MEDTLNCLGSPETLAKAYTAHYQLKQDKLKLSPIISVLRLGSLGIVGTVLLPTLLFLSLLLIILAIFIIGIATTNLLGITYIPLMVITSNYTLTGFPQFISSLFICSLMITIGIFLLKLIKKYCKFVLKNYKSRMMNRISETSREF